MYTKSRETLIRYAVFLTWAIVLGFSVLRAFGPKIPENYFSNEKNWLNMTMVKWAWGWTLYSLLPFGLLVGWTSAEVKQNCLRSIIKIGLLGTVIWFFGTELTFKIGDLTGICYDENSTEISGYTSRRQCRSVTGSWESFDISGHTFLLTWCVYLTVHELYSFYKFLESNHSFVLESMVFLFFGWNVVLNLVWIIMLCSTQLFFHSIPEKIVAKLMADISLLCFLRIMKPLDSYLPLEKAKTI